MCENGDPIIHLKCMKMDTRAREIIKTVGMSKVINFPFGKGCLINFLSSELLLVIWHQKSQALHVSFGNGCLINFLSSELLLVIWSQKSQCHVGFAYPLQKSQCHVGFAYHPQKSTYRVSFAQSIIIRKCMKMGIQQITQNV